MRRLAMAVVVTAAAACQNGASSNGATSAAGSGSASTFDASACERAIADASNAPPLARMQLLFAGCKPCDDAALLDWQRAPTAGGPTRLAIMTSLDSCHAYCNSDAHQGFLDALDPARGTPSLTPWRRIAKTCGEKSGFRGDAVLFPTAALFVLDRIAAEVRSHGGDAATALASMQLPMPAWSKDHGWLVLPPAPAGTVAEALPRALTITLDDVRIGDFPTAHFDAMGVAIDWHQAPYPGAPLGDRAELAGDFTLVAPAQMPAKRVLDVLSQLRVGKLLLAVSVMRADWPLVGALPVAVSADGSDTTAPKVHITDDMTVTDLSTELAKLAATGATRAALVR